MRERVRERREGGREREGKAGWSETIYGGIREEWKEEGMRRNW